MRPDPERLADTKILEDLNLETKLQQRWSGYLGNYGFSG
jgi:hypothetical protein